MRQTYCNITGRIKEIEDCKINLDKMNFARAGWLYNGEGCLSFYRDKQIYKGKKYYYPRLMMVVTQRHPEVLYNFERFLGCGKVSGPVSNGCRTWTGIIYRWQESKFEIIQHAICCIWDELSSEKKAQTKEAFKNYLEAVQKNRAIRAPRAENFRIRS